MKEYFLGVDGGGSKTTAVVADNDGNIISRTVGGSINYYSNPLATTRSNMTEILRKIEAETGVRCFRGAFIGMSALNSRADEDELHSFADGVIDASAIGMDSDLFIALETLLTNGECAVVISGTGSMVVARDGAGVCHHAGGWGYILGDEGSGYRMSLDAIQAAVRAADGYGNATQLTGELMSFFGADSLDSLVDIFYNPPIERQAIAAFLPRVRACADRGDATAQRIITEGADTLANTAISLLRQFSNGMPIGLWGGAFQHTPLFSESFVRRLSESGITNAFLLRFPPEIGAIFAAYKLCGIRIDERILDNISAHN